MHFSKPSQKAHGYQKEQNNLENHGLETKPREGRAFLYALHRVLHHLHAKA